MSFGLSRPHRSVKPLVAIGAALTAPGMTAVGFAQTVAIDDRRFNVTRAGLPLGREEFSIRRAAPSDSSALSFASGTATSGSRRVTSTLRTRATVFRSRTTRRSATARLAFSAYAVDELFHHPFFLTMAGAGGAVRLPVPQRGVRLGATLSREGADSVTIAGRVASATRFTLRGTGRDGRTVWRRAWPCPESLARG